MLLRALPTLLLLALLGTAGCGGEAGRGAPAVRCEALVRAEPARPRNVVLVLSDTLRRDRLGAYGGPARTPHFDRFAAKGVLFTAATTQAPWTKPSIATLFTGLPPSAHGVVSHPGLRSNKAVVDSDVVAEELETLAEALAAAGYRTAAFVSNPWLQRRLGFAQGFETYMSSFAANSTPGERVSAAGLDWLRDRPRDGRPFFLYLHYMDAHRPYLPVPAAALAARRAALAADQRPVTPHARTQIARMMKDEARRPLLRQGVEPNLAALELVYDQGVEQFDRALGRFLEGLEQMEGAEGAAVWITSDHGEALYERGWSGHGHGLYEEEAGVPLAAQLPGVATRGRVSCPVGLVDLRATLCDYLGVPCRDTGHETSLFAPELAEPERVVVTEAVIGRPGNRAVRDQRFKLLYEPEGRRRSVPPLTKTYSLYDLERDPGEQHDLLADAASEETRDAFERLRAAAEASVAQPGAAAERVPIDDATRKRLEALGYLEAD